MQRSSSLMLMHSAFYGPDIEKSIRSVFLFHVNVGDSNELPIYTEMFVWDCKGSASAKRHVTGNKLETSSTEQDGPLNFQRVKKLLQV